MLDESKKPALLLRSLAVQRMPGIRSPGFEMRNLGSGINVVFGPNASGKTTTAAAIRCLMWPQIAPPQAAIDAEVLVADKPARFSLHSGVPDYGGEAPRVVGADQADRYSLGLHNLLVADGAGYAKQIVAEALGGYSVDEATRVLQYGESLGVPTRTTEFQRLKEAQKRAKEARKAQEQALQAQERLEKTQHDLEEAEIARKWADVYQAAIEYLTQRAKVADADAQLRAFPEQVQKMDEAFEERINHLKQQAEECRQRVQELAAQSCRAVEALKETGLLRRAVSPGQLDRLDELASRLERAEENAAELEDKLRIAELHRNDAARRLGPEVDQDVLRGVNLEALHVASQFVRDAADVAAQLRAREELRAVLQPGEQISRDPDEAVKLLREWLRSSSGVPPVALWFGIGGGLLLGAGMALALTIHPAFWALCGTGTAFMMVAALRRRSAWAAEIPGRFRLTGFAEPASWMIQDVTRRLQELETAVIDFRLEARRQEVERRYSGLDDRAHETQRRAQELASILGVASKADDSGFYGAWLAQYAELVRAWREAEDQCVQLRSSLAAAQCEQAEVLAEVNRIVAPYDAGSAQSSSTAKGAIRRLREREDRRSRARAEMDRCRGELRRLCRDWRRVRQQLEEAYGTVGLEPGDEGGLHRMRELRREWAEVRQERQKSATLEANAMDALLGRSIPDDRFPRMRQWLEDLATHRAAGTPAPHPLDAAALEEEARRLEHKAERGGVLRTELGSLRQQIDQALGDRRLEKALAELDAAQSAYHRKVEEALRKVTGWCIAQEVSQQTQEFGLPEVFHRAKDYLHAFTQGRYRLELHRSSGAFQVWDTVDEEHRCVDELSTGTRIQLLLAVRLAFIECQEPGPMLPLLLDETLADSDEHRMDAAITAIGEVARAGRQVFYFTCRPEEVARWRQAAAAGVPVQVVDLKSVRNAAGPDLVTVAVQELPVPDPAGMDHEEYGRSLGVPGFVPGNGIGWVHLWHFVTDGTYLQHLLRLGIERWGQVEAEWRRPSGGDARVEAIRSQALGIAAIYRRVDEVWREGRAGRLTQEALERSGCMTTAAFREGLLRVAREVDWDGTRFVERLDDGAVPRFGGQKLRRLREFLMAEGILAEGQPRTPEEVRSAALAAAEEQVRAGRLDAAQARQAVERACAAIATAS
ncbi:MAG: hypothetical protein ACP5VE_05450 [Chthonomonadales bacterium]